MPNTEEGAIWMNHVGCSGGGTPPTRVTRTISRAITTGHITKPTPNCAHDHAVKPKGKPAKGAITLPTMGTMSMGVTGAQGFSPAGPGLSQRLRIQAVVSHCQIEATKNKA